MKLVLLLLLPAILYGERLVYETGTTGGLSDVETSSKTLSNNDKLDVTDDDTTTGPNMGRFLTFDISATVSVPDGKAYFEVSNIQVILSSECDFDALESSAAISYVDKDGVTVIVDEYTFEYESFLQTYTLTLATTKVGEGSVISINGFDFTSCEPETSFVEIIVEGEFIETAEPTPQPTEKPSTMPTTATPTWSPTGKCDGEITWGDPHYWIWEDHSQQYDYQGLGYYYYMHPCDYSQRDDWPFFVEVYHQLCYWQGNKKGCAQHSKLTINTKPDPYIIQFGTSAGFEVIQSGTDVGGNDYMGSTIGTKNNPLTIDYDDGNGRTGTLEVWKQNGQHYVVLSNVRWDASPENNACEGGINCGEFTCPGTWEARMAGTWIWFKCFACFRHYTCGMIGKYLGGDCVHSQMNNVNDPCYYTWQSPWDTCFHGTKGNAVFGQLADSWEESYVDAGVPATIPGGSCDVGSATPLKSHHPKPEGRDLSVNIDIDYPGECGETATDQITANGLIQYFNQTCYENTIVKYDRCCKEIGFCDLLQKGCLFDMCSCTSNRSETDTDAVEKECLTTIVHESMNTTCSVKELWPTSTPTSAPTPTPTGLIAGLPGSTTAEDLVWIMAIFVVLFCVIAAGAYFWYRKKNSGKAYMDQDDDVQMADTQIQYTGASHTSA